MSYNRALRWFCYSCTVIFLCLVATSSCQCEIECSYLSKLPPRWGYENKDVPNIVLMCTVSSVCSLDINMLLLNYTNGVENSTYTYVDMYFSCLTDEKFEFAATKLANSSILAAVRVADCNTTWEDIGNVGEKYHLLEVETVVNSTRLPPPKQAQKVVKGLGELRYISFTFLSNNITAIAEDFLPYRILPIETVASLVIQCQSSIPKKSDDVPRIFCSQDQVSLNSSLLHQLYPHLQALSLSGVHLTDRSTVLNFPWDDQSMNLPYNLTHSKFRQRLLPDECRRHGGSHQFARTWSINGSKVNAIENICPYQRQLHTVVFEENNINYIPMRCFTPPKDQKSLLHYLDLTNNKLRSFDYGTFAGLSNLETMHLRMCSLMSLSVGLFDDLVNLKLLDLDYNYLTHLQAGLLTKLVSLQSLFIHGNLLHYIEHMSFPIYSPNLTFVDLRWNHLESLPYDCITLPNLNLCDCDYNRITFENFTDLISYFDPVRMYFVQPLAFYGETYNPADVGIMHENDHSEISLRSNAIETIVFSNTWSIERKRQLAAFLSFFQINLEFMNVSSTWECDCSLYHLKQFIHSSEAANIIKETAYPESLMLSETNFQSWKCRVNPVLETESMIQPFLKMPSDKFVCKYHSFICPEHCSCFTSAGNPDVLLDCSNQGLTKLPSDIPIPADGGQLVVILKHNLIFHYENCENAGYEWLYHVTRLDLEHNEITPHNTQDTYNFLRCLKKIQYLFLAYNNIEYLPMSISQLEYKNLSISGNKLICDCTTYWLKLWLQKKNASIQRSQTMQCLHNAIPIVQMEKDDFKCSGIIAYMGTMAGLISSMVIIIGICISCYIYRFEIKVHLFEKWNWHPFDKQDEDQRKEYDVYLMYCQEDEGWVINTLLVGLKLFGYKTCVPDRDFTIGASTAEEMAAAFSKSRRVLVIISQRFVDNVHAMSDFYHAYEHDRSATRKRFLVLIKLREKINFGDRHEIFKRYLSTNYFVPIQARSFWSRLRYWLPPLKQDKLPASMDNVEPEQDNAKTNEENSFEPSEETPLLL